MARHPVVAYRLDNDENVSEAMAHPFQAVYRRGDDSDTDDDESCSTWLECSKCSEAPPGAPPSVFRSFAQPIYFAGILNAALGVCNCANCGVDGRVCVVCSGHHRRSHHYATRTMMSPPSNNATPSMPRHSSGLTQLSDSYVEDPVPTRMMGYDDYHHRRRKLYYYPGTISSPSNEGRRRTTSSRIASPGYLMQSQPLSTSGFDSPLLRRIPSTRTDATETAFSSDSLSRATADSASIEGRQTLLSMEQARQAGFLGTGSCRLQPGLIRPSLDSSPSPPATFSTQPLRLRETTWSSRQTPHDGRTSRRSYQVTQVDTDDAIYRNENSTVTTRTLASSRRRLSHMQGRRRAFIAESVGAATESEEPSVALAAAENGGRLLRRCRRCGSYSSCQPTFRLPGEPQSAARWCDKCPGKPFHALSGDVETASTKRRRVDGDDAAEPRVARRLAVTPEDPSSNAALRRTGNAANNPDCGRKLKPAINAAGVATGTTRKR